VPEAHFDVEPFLFENGVRTFAGSLFFKSLPRFHAAHADVAVPADPDAFYNAPSMPPFFRSCQKRAIFFSTPVLFV